MRTIKFRAWDNMENKMITDTYDIFDQGPNSYIMQYTGLYDKQGTPIYEGDINEEFEVINYCEYCMGYRLFIYKFNKDGSDYCMIDGGEYDIDDMKKQVNKTIIIGNIYENPELLTN